MPFINLVLGIWASIKMVQGFSSSTTKDNVGLYVGLIRAASCIGICISSMPWGMISDRIGRRPVLVLSIGGSAIGIFMIGMSESITWIVSCSLLMGLLDGSMPALRCFVSEITIHHTNTQRSLAMSALDLGIGLGCAIGPLIGSLLMDPAKQYPGMLPTTTSSWLKDLLVMYPYMLPCFVSSFISMVVATCAFAILEETAPPYRMKPETCSSLQSHEQHHTAGYKTFQNRLSPPLKDEQTQQRKSLRIYQLLRESLTRPIFLGINMKSFNGFYSAYYQTLFAIWTAWNVHQGGLGFSSSEIGSTFFYAGMWQVVAQFTILPILTKRFSNLHLLRMLLIGTAINFSIFGMIHCIYDRGSYDAGNNMKDNKRLWVWIAALVLISLITSLDNMASTVSMVLVNNAASSRPSTLGTVNGCTNVALGLALATGPATAGVIWSIAQNIDWIEAPLRGILPWQFIALFLVIPLSISYLMNSRDYEIPRPIDTAAESTPIDPLIECC